jgi:hypothetical protein
MRATSRLRASGLVRASKIITGNKENVAYAILLAIDRCRQAKFTVVTMLGCSPYLRRIIAGRVGVPLETGDELPQLRQRIARRPD